MSSVAPSRKEIAHYYKTHRSEFAVPQQVRVFQIAKNVDELASREVAMAAMKKALAELEAKTAFGAVADRYSDCAGNGGELGWIERGTMVEEFDQVVFDLAIGHYSPIFETCFGLHIALVTEKRGPGALPLALVSDRIAQMLAGR